MVHFSTNPLPDYAGDDLFSYRVSDGVDESAVVYVQLEVEQVNDLPTILPDTYFGMPDADAADQRGRRRVVKRLGY